MAHLVFSYGDAPSGLLELPISHLSSEGVSCAPSGWDSLLVPQPLSGGGAGAGCTAEGEGGGFGTHKPAENSPSLSSAHKL